MRGNQAKHLYEILIQAQRLKDITLIEVWATVFNVDKSNQEEVYKRVIKLINLIDNIQKAIKYDNDITDKELYLAPFIRIKQVIITHLNNQNAKWDQIKNQFIIPIEQLKYSVNHFENKNTKFDLAKEDLENLENEVDKLLDWIKKANLEEDLRNMCFVYLGAIRESIELYDISGVEGLEQAFNALLGKVLIYNIKHKNQKEEDKEAYSKITKFIGILSNVLGLGNESLKLGENMGKVVHLLMDKV